MRYRHGHFFLTWRDTRLVWFLWRWCDGHMVVTPSCLLLLWFDVLYQAYGSLFWCYSMLMSQENLTSVKTQAVYLVVVLKGRVVRHNLTYVVIILMFFLHLSISYHITSHHSSSCKCGKFTVILFLCVVLISCSLSFH